MSSIGSQGPDCRRTRQLQENLDVTSRPYCRADRTRHVDPHVRRARCARLVLWRAGPAYRDHPSGGRDLDRHQRGTRTHHRRPDRKAAKAAVRGLAADPRRAQRPGVDAEDLATAARRGHPAVSRQRRGPARRYPVPGRFAANPIRLRRAREKRHHPGRTGRRLDGRQAGFRRRRDHRSPRAAVGRFARGVALGRTEFPRGDQLLDRPERRRPATAPGARRPVANYRQPEANGRRRPADAGQAADFHYRRTGHESFRPRVGGRRLPHETAGDELRAGARRRAAQLPGDARTGPPRHEQHAAALVAGPRFRPAVARRGRDLLGVAPRECQGDGGGGFPHRLGRPAPWEQGQSGRAAVGRQHDRQVRRTGTGRSDLRPVAQLHRPGGRRRADRQGGPDRQGGLPAAGDDGLLGCAARQLSGPT